MDRPLGWAAFVAVEVGAEVARRHVLETQTGVLSSPVVALVAVTLWTYLAHTRLTFRATPNAGLTTAPMYLAVSIALAIMKNASETSAASDLYVSWSLAVVLAAKFFVLKHMVWPSDRNGL